MEELGSIGVSGMGWVIEGVMERKILARQEGWSQCNMWHV
jgi:hypothetical protein